MKTSLFSRISCAAIMILGCWIGANANATIANPGQTLQAALQAIVFSNTPETTVLHYNFNDGFPNVPMNATGLTEQIGSHDISGNGRHMYAWDNYNGPLFSNLGQTPTGRGLSAAFDGHRDGYCFDSDLLGWSPDTWTIELAFKLDDLSGWRTFIGRDGWVQFDGQTVGFEASFYLQKNAVNGAVRLNFATVSGERYVLDSSLFPSAGKWYRFAVVAAGDHIQMYSAGPDGSDWQDAGSFLLTTGLDHSLLPTGIWTFGRGWYYDAFVDHIIGSLDDIRFSNVALTPDQFLRDQTNQRFYVYPGQSIQAAIDAAVHGDEIQVAPGIYKEAIDFKGKAVRLYSSGGAAVTTINGNNAYHVVKCVSGETVNAILDGFTITGGKAIGNEPDGFGGGMYIDSSSPTIIRCIFFGNSARDGGGGLANLYGKPIISNCLFRSNSVTTDTLPIGGGILNMGSGCRPTVTHCTFYGNTALWGGAAIHNFAYVNATITNCILWGNNGGGDPRNDEIGSTQSTVTLTYSVVEGGSGQPWFGTGCIAANPMFVNAAAGDFGLAPCSPCIDSGNNAAIGADLTYDLMLNPRFVDDTGIVDTGVGTAPIVDMGACERQTNTSNWIYNRTQGTQFCNGRIQSAIDQANNGDQIEVTPGTYIESINFKGKAIRLYGSGGPEVTTINGNNSYHVIQCISGEGEGTILEGFTITGGNANGSADLDKCGGGMLNVSSSPTIKNCIFRNNAAVSGGGMYNKLANPAISGCLFQGNSTLNGVDYAIYRETHGNHGGSAGHGGGLYNVSSSPILRDCRFMDNRTGNGGKGQKGSNGGFLSNGKWGGNGGNGGAGAGICNEASEPQIINCRFSGNQTGDGGQGGDGGDEGWGMNHEHSGGTGGTGGNGGSGAGIFNTESSPTVTDCEFINNSTGSGGHGGNAHNAGGDGGNGGWGGYGAGIETYLGSLDLNNCVFGGNTTGSGGGGGDTDSDIFSDGGTGGNGGAGGGIYNEGNTGKVTNCTFFRNRIGGGGKGGTGSFLNSGSPGYGGGIANYNTSNLSFFVTNCILRENDQEIVFYMNQTIATVTYCNINAPLSDLLPHCMNADPHFVDVGNPDLDLCNFRLQLDSPCIDAGDNNAPGLPAADLDGHPRILDGDCDRTPRTDMGAYELNYADEGDFNYNCTIDLPDLLLLAQSWMTHPGDTAWDRMRDISDPKDQQIDLGDLAVMAENWHKRESYRIYRNKLDSNPGWTTEGQWAFGKPTGGGGSSMGNPDPTSGKTGTNVYGVNLSGDYTVGLGGPYSLTMGPIDCRGYHDVKLSFARWLNTDGPGFVLCAVDASNDGNAWTTIWQNDSVITDSRWTSVEYDVGSVADNQETVFIRWTYAVVDRAYAYSGWNIDDIGLSGKY